MSLVWIAGALADGEARVAIWIAALALDYLGPAAGHWTPGLGRSDPRDWELVPSHFIERIKLFVIIALGEAIVATGRTASELEPTTARIVGVVLAFWVTAAFWWLYFDYHAERALQELSERRNERGRVGRDLTYVHIPMIAGIIVTAVANEIVIAHPDADLHGRELLVVAGGPVLYLLGSLAFKVRVLRMFSVWRVIATLLVVVAAALGTVLPALVTWSVVVAVLTALAVSERFGVARGTPLTRSATAERSAIG